MAEISGGPSRSDSGRRVVGIERQSGVLDRTRVSVATDRQWASHAPFATVAARSEFTGDRIALLDDSGRVIEAQAQPRELFAGHTLETPWNALQLAFLPDVRCGRI